MKIRNKLPFNSRGASMTEYALVLGLIIGLTIIGRGALLTATEAESSQQKICVSEIPPPPGCNIPEIPEVTTIPPITTTTSTTSTIPPTTIAPEPPPAIAQASAPTDITIVPGYTAAGDQTLTATFNEPTNAEEAGVITYEYTTNGGVSWKTRQSGTLDQTLVITTPSNSSLALLPASTYQVAVRAVGTNGTKGKRSEIWQVGTTRARSQCSNGTYCAFTTEKINDTLWGLHKTTATVVANSHNIQFFSATSSNIILVGGGGGGGGDRGGGGGGGGVYCAMSGTTGCSGGNHVIIAGTFVATAGKGGDAGTATSRGRRGEASSLGGLFANGGGGGAARVANQPESYAETSNSNFTLGPIGSAGGGSDADQSISNSRSIGGTGIGTTVNYSGGIGRNGGNGCSTSSVNICSPSDAGGGGGGGAINNGGSSSSLLRGGNGGGGITVNFDGVAKTFAAGGGGGRSSTSLAGGYGGSCSDTSLSNACIGGSSWRVGYTHNGAHGRGAGGAGGNSTSVAADQYIGAGGGGAVIVRYSIPYSLVSPAET
jgi:hypothetical protein